MQCLHLRGSQRRILILIPITALSGLTVHSDSFPFIPSLSCGVFLFLTKNKLSSLEGTSAISCRTCKQNCMCTSEHSLCIISTKIAVLCHSAILQWHCRVPKIAHKLQTIGKNKAPWSLFWHTWKKERANTSVYKSKFWVQTEKGLIEEF